MWNNSLALICNNSPRINVQNNSESILKLLQKSQYNSGIIPGLLCMHLGTIHKAFQDYSERIQELR